MTLKFNNIYINETSVVGGPYLIDGPLKAKLDSKFYDYYDGESTFEDCEIKQLNKAVNILLDKSNINKDDIDIMLSSDLSNQLYISNEVANNLKIPYFGIYTACASFCEELIIASFVLSNKAINKAVCTTSCNIATSERQFRGPVEYGLFKPEYSTFTVSSGTACLVSKEKSNIKIDTVTIGKVVDLEIKDGFDMGSVMTPGAADTLYEHLTESKRDPEYYDLILTGDLGKYGEKIFKEYCDKTYGIKLKNYKDSATLIYNNDDKETLAGGSGPSCLPTYLFCEVIPKLKSGEIKRVLLLATGALFNSTSVLQKKSIPCICHAVSLEAI